MKQHSKEEKWFKNGAKYSLIVNARSITPKSGRRNQAGEIGQQMRKKYASYVVMR